MSESYLYKCSECCKMQNMMSVDMYMVDGETVCKFCVPFCAVCGDHIDDQAPEEWGPGVNVRIEGHRCVCHAECAAGVFIGGWHFDPSTATRESIQAELKGLVAA